MVPFPSLHLAPGLQHVVNHKAILKAPETGMLATMSGAVYLLEYKRPRMIGCTVLFCLLYAGVCPALCYACLPFWFFTSRHAARFLFLLLSTSNYWIVGFVSQAASELWRV